MTAPGAPACHYCGDPAAYRAATPIGRTFTCRGDVAAAVDDLGPSAPGQAVVVSAIDRYTRDT